MAPGGVDTAIIDTSVLLNFLRIDRADLLGSYKPHRFVVIDFIDAEVRAKGLDDRLGAAYAAGHILRDDRPETTATTEIATFASMARVRISEADRAAVAAAVARSCPLAMDDKSAWKLAGPFCVDVPRLETVTIMVALIEAGAITVADADKIKAEWAAKHKFHKPSFTSFGELISFEF